MTGPATDPVAAIVLAAGLGTRMRSTLPKVLHPLAGRPLIAHALAALREAGIARPVVVTGPGQEAVARAVAPCPTVVQPRPLGTGDAVRPARTLLRGFTGTVLILFGDTPLLTAASLRAMLAARAGPPPAGLVVAGFDSAEPGAYGRLLLDGDGMPEAIVEARDASEAERRITLCNGGVMAVDGEILFPLLDRLSADNAKGEFYLTDLVGLVRAAGRRTRLVMVDETEAMGVDSRAGLARAEALMQDRLRLAMLAAGIGMTAPDTVHLCCDTRIGRDSIIEPYVVFGPGVQVGERARINSFSHLEGVRIGDGAAVGPFARLRPGAVIGREARIGNFVEVKNAEIEAGAKAGHLSYLGDARVGAGANIGAGTITCNYDGFDKHRTEIGAGAFIGSNTALVAPVTVGEGAVVGAGSTITRDVGAGDLAVARGEQRRAAGGGRRWRRRRDRPAKTGEG